MENNQRPSLKNKVGFALGHVMNDMCASMWFTYLLLYFHEVLKFDNIYAGVVLLIGKKFIKKYKNFRFYIILLSFIFSSPTHNFHISSKSKIWATFQILVKTSYNVGVENQTKF